MEDGAISYPDTGSPQGGVISPMLANVYLHYVLDEWIARDVQPRLRGRTFVVRYADDFVIGFTHEDDARRVWDVLPKRFGKYGLTVHPEKTRLVPFRRPATRPASPGRPPADPPGTFDLLGFTHYWARSRKGNWVVKRKTAPSRRAPSQMVGGRSGRSPTGAASIGTIRSRSNTKHCARNSAATSPTTGSRATASRWPGSGKWSRASGGNGLAVGGAGTGPLGPNSCYSSSAGRCRRRLPSIRCAAREAKGLLEEPYAVILHVRVCGSPG